MRMKNRILKSFLRIAISLALAAGIFSPLILSVRAEEYYLPIPDENGVIKLYDDVKLNNGRIFNEDLILDLNGHFLTTYGGETLKITGGTFTIIDSSENKSGQIRNNCTTLDYAAILVQGGTVNLYNGTIGECNNDCVQVYSGTFNMYGGKIRNLHGTGVEVYGGNFNLYDGIIETKFTGILFGGSGKMNITGGTFTRITGGFNWTAAVMANDKYFNLSGSPVFEGFTTDLQLRCLDHDQKYPTIILDDDLNTTSIKVTVQDLHSDPSDDQLPIVITKGLKEHGSLDNFTSVQETEGAYTLKLNEEGEAMLVKPVTVKITFHANDGTDSTEVQSVILESDSVPVNTKLRANGFTREHYTFLNWNTSDDGTGTEYQDGATVSVNEDMDLHAIWEPVVYTITYDLDGGTNNEANPDQYTIETETFELNAPEKEGYDFVGWCPDDDPDPIRRVIIDKGSYGNRTYKAVWDRKTPVTGDPVSRHLLAVLMLTSLAGFGLIYRRKH